MKFLSNILIKAGLVVEGSIDLQGSATSLTPSTSDNSNKIATTAFVKGQGYLTSAVPYTGATNNVNLGEFGLSTGYVTYDTTPTNTPTTQGTTYWDSDNDTIAAVLNGYVMRIGEDLFYPVKNQSGSTIAKGTAVRFAGTLGMSGRLLIVPFIANGSVQSSFFMGVAAEDIADGADGKVLWFGRIRGINTNAFNEGDVLYASTSSAGSFQTEVPQAPNNIVQIAAVITKSTNNGVIFVRPTLGSNISKDEGVKLTGVATGDLLQYQSNGLWENKTKAQILGGTSSQFVKGDGTLDSTIYLSTTGAAGLYVPLTRTVNGKDLSSNVTLTTSDISEGTNLYYTDARSRSALSFAAGSGAYNSSTGVITIPTNTNQLTNGAGFITGYTETDTLASVTGRGASTSTNVTFNGTLTSAGQTVLAGAFRFYTGGTDGSTAYGDFRTNPATGNSIISAKSNALYFNYDHGTGGVIFCDGATGIVATVSAAGVAVFNGNVTGASFIKSGGTSSQFLKADGSVDSNTYLTGITSSMVTTALGYTPYNATNPNGYTSNTGTVTSVSGTGSVSGITLSGSVTTSGSLTLGGTLSLTSGQVTSALGYTPYNSTNPNGYITSSGTAAAVSQTVSGTNSAELVRGNMADNDQFRILVGGTATNSGFVEIATADDGTEPIYVRQYTGVFTSLVRTATLLDGSGNTSFPGSVSASSFSGSISSSMVTNALGYTPVQPNGTGASGTWGINITGSAGYASGAGNSDTVDGFHADAFYRNIGFEGGGSDANTIPESRSAFTYAVNAPLYGPIIHIGASGYGLQLNAMYNSGGGAIYYRTRNGDAGTWNTWREFVHSGNYANFNSYVSLSISGTLNLPNNALISVNNEPDTWGARFRTTTSTTNLGAQLKNIIWCGGGSSEGIAFSGVGTGGAAMEVFNNGSVYIKDRVIAPYAIFTNDTNSRVMYLRGSGNIIQFQDGAAVNKWEVVGREGTFYVYKNDGAGTGYRWQINSSGDHTFSGTVNFNSAVNSPSGYVSNGNPWGTANSAYFPNGITTAGGTNWVYGHTYLGNAPTNGSGAEVRANGSSWFRSSSTSQSFGYAGIFVDRSSAATNYAPWSFESEYGNHSWGVVARFHIQQASADRPSIVFSNGTNNTRWGIGYCYYDDNFRITQNLGMAPDGSGGGWGTERFRINTDGVVWAYSNFNASGDITAYASDMRLKENISIIDGALDKVKMLTGMTYNWNNVGKEYGWSPTSDREVGVFAQDVQRVLPEAVKLAPFDNDGNGNSKSGKNFLTVKYEKIVPLLIEAIKEQQKQIEELKSKLN